MNGFRAAFLEPLDKETRLRLMRLASNPVPTTLLIVSAYFAFITLAHLIVLDPPVSFIMGTLAAVSSLACAALGWNARRHRIHWVHAHATTAAGVLIVWANVSLHLLLTGLATESANFVFLLVGTGIVLISSRWFIGLLLLEVGTWAVIASALGGGPAWQQPGFLVLGGAILAVVAHITRKTTCVHLVLSRAREDAQRRALEVAYTDLSAFSHTLSHDLRAPARDMQSLAQLALEDADDGVGDPIESLRRLEHEAQKLRAIIDDVTTLSLAGESDLRPERVDVGAAAGRILEDFMMREPERRVFTRIEPGLAVMVDPRLLDLTLLNVLGNAWKYTAGRHPARIEVARGSAGEDGLLHIEVRDNGVGFSEGEGTDIFLPFHRLPSAAGFQGTGLGLATVRRAVERMGGRVWAEGEEGVGATFHLALPPVPDRSRWADAVAARVGGGATRGGRGRVS